MPADIPRLAGGGFCPVRATNIPEAIHILWGLSLSRFRPDAYGSHLTYLASVDITANGQGGPATAQVALKQRGCLRDNQARPGSAQPSFDDLGFAQVAPLT